MRDAHAAAREAGAGGACGWEYAIVLTKADKAAPKALRRTERALRAAIDELRAPEPVGVVRTSSKAKAGREGMWRLMRPLVLGEEEQEAAAARGAAADGEGVDASLTTLISAQEAALEDDQEGN